MTASRIKALWKGAEKIRQIIERIDHRAMAADGPVTPTEQEITGGEEVALELALGEMVKAT
jgi:hypothetical protein